MLVSRDRSLWVVKGCYHPPNGVVAVPRLFGGRRVKRFRDSLAIVARYYRHYMRYLPVLGLRVPVVPWSDVREYLSVFEEGLGVLEGSGELVRACRGLVRLLSDYCGLKCGVSGSLLGGYYTGSSDVDLICIDREGAYGCLKRLRELGYLKPLSGRLFWSELAEISESLSAEDHARLVSSKVLQGVFSGVKYTLRVVNCCEARLGRVLGPYRAAMTVSDVVLRVVSSDYRTPSIHGVEVVRPWTSYLSGEAVLISYRVRFTELPEGALVLADRAELHVKDVGPPILCVDSAGSRVMVA